MVEEEEGVVEEEVEGVAEVVAVPFLGFHLTWSIICLRGIQTSTRKRFCDDIPIYFGYTLQKRQT